MAECALTVPGIHDGSSIPLFPLSGLPNLLKLFHQLAWNPLSPFLRVFLCMCVERKECVCNLWRDELVRDCVVLVDADVWVYCA